MSSTKTPTVEPTVVCSACSRSEPNPKVEGARPDRPEGWSVVTVAKAGSVVRNDQLCPHCTDSVESLLRHLRAAT